MDLGRTADNSWTTTPLDDFYNSHNAAEVQCLHEEHPGEDDPLVSGSLGVTQTFGDVIHTPHSNYDNHTFVYIGVDSGNIIHAAKTLLKTLPVVPPRLQPYPRIPQYFDAWDDISWDILSETPLGETDESIDSPPPLYEDTMASIPSFSQEVRRVLNSGSTTDLWLYSRKSPSPPLDDAEDHLSTISYHGYSKFLDGTKEDTHLQIVRKSYDNSSIIPSLLSESSFDWSDVNIPYSSIVERVYYGSQNGDLNNITQGPTKSHRAKRQREDDNPRSEPPKRKRTTSPPPVSPNHHQTLSGKRKVDDNDNEYVPKYSSHQHPSDIASSQPMSRSAKRQRINSSDHCQSDQDDGGIEKDHNEELPGPSS
ncbi:hypothetical protein BU17DRAFT_97021 [Hysterangium stoloniferum]|nr:hypothetical protein BU17DRAFT_97021 [Hysterangium stoloniferum]